MSKTVDFVFKTEEGRPDVAFEFQGVQHFGASQAHHGKCPLYAALAAMLAEKAQR